MRRREVSLEEGRVRGDGAWKKRTSPSAGKSEEEESRLGTVRTIEQWDMVW